MGATSEQELLTPSGEPPVFSGVRLALSLVFCEVLCRSLFFICTFSYGRCIVCPSSKSGF